MLGASFSSTALAQGLFVNPPSGQTIKQSTTPAAKQTSTQEVKKASSSSSKQTSVQKALSQIQTKNAKINLNADYYIYYFSASWCGPCQKLMPSTVAEYNEMKRSGKVELILVCGDKTLDAAAAYVKKHKAKFPVLLSSSPDAKKLPSCKSAGYIPAACIIDKNGKILKSGHGSIVKDWKNICSSSPDAADTHNPPHDEPKGEPKGGEKDETLVDKVLDFSIRKLFD